MSSGPAPDISEAAATGRVAALFADVRDALGSTFVPTVYRRLAAHPDALAAAVAPLRQIVSLAEQERFTDGATQRAASLLPASVAPQPTPPAELRAVVERYRRTNPLNLLFAVAVLGAGTPLGPVMEPPLGPPRADEDDDIEACHGGVVLPGLWRELGEWGSWRSSAWRSIRADAEAGHLSAARRAVLGSAVALVAESSISAQDEVVSSLGDEAADELRRFPAVIASMVVEAEWLLHAMDNHTEE